VGHEIVSRDATFRGGPVDYGIAYRSCWDPAHGPGVGYLEGTIGMPGPTAANWYHGGFLHLTLNGHNLGTTKLSDMWVSETGSRASLRLYWDTADATVLASFLTLPGDDRLYVALDLTPKVEIKELQVALQCYPSYFTYANKRTGDRKVLTATKTLNQDDNVAVDPASQWWLAFYDTVFDPARGEGDGGCAVAFRPEQVASAQVSVGSYGCTTTLRYAPGTRRLRLAFWDANKRANAVFLTDVQREVAATRDLLASLDFAPLALVSYDAATKRDAALKDLAPVAGNEPLAAKVKAAADGVLAARQALQQAAGPSPAATEQGLREAIEAFEQLLWDVRFFVLIHG
jgi:hypothetical protein